MVLTLIFVFSPRSILFLEICSKSQNCLLKLKFKISINLNMSNSMVISIFLVWKYTFCVNLIQKFKSHFKTKFGTYSWVSNRRSSSPPLINFLIFFFTQNIVLPPLSPLLINYWGKFSTRVWNDILILTYLWPCKRSEPSVVCFVLQVRAKKPTQCFVL